MNKDINGKLASYSLCDIDDISKKTYLHSWKKQNIFDLIKITVFLVFVTWIGSIVYSRRYHSDIINTCVGIGTLIYLITILITAVIFAIRKIVHYTKSKKYNWKKALIYVKENKKRTLQIEYIDENNLTQKQIKTFHGDGIKCFSENTFATMIYIPQLDIYFLYANTELFFGSFKFYV